MDEPGSSAPASPEATSHNCPIGDERDQSESVEREESGMRSMSSEVEDIEESGIDIIFGGAGETEDDDEDHEGNDNDDDDEDEEDGLEGYGRLHHIIAGPVGATCGNIC
jgi:hypothetical protein